MLVPYIIIGVMGGGATLEALSTIGGVRMAPGSTAVSYEVGGAIVALVVMSYVFFGGMRGTAWVNTFQTLLFLGFGTIAFWLIAPPAGRLRPDHAAPGGEPEDRAAADARAHSAGRVLQLHLHPALVDHVPAHLDHVPDREAGHRLQDAR